MWLGLLLGAAVAALAAGILYERVGRRRDAARLPPPGRLIDLGDRRIHLHDLGAGPVAVVFESGLAASSLNWRPVQEAVAPHARACAYDRAGFGWSDRAPGLRTARSAVHDLGHLLARAGIQPPYVLVAHSFGAYVVLLYAAEHVEDVAGVVLVDPLTPEEWESPGPVERRIARGGRVLALIGAGLAAAGVVRFLLRRTGEGGSSLSQLVLRLFGHEADAAVRRVVGEVTKLPRTLWPAVRAQWSRPAGFLTLAQQFRALTPSALEVRAVLDSHEGADRLSEQPMVVVSAATCSPARLAAHERLADRSRHSSHVRACAGGHWVHLDEPEVVATAIRELVERARTDRAEASAIRRKA